MVSNKNFVVEVSITPDAYDSKETVNIFFQNPKDESVKQYKKDHGFRRNSSIKFYRGYYSVEEIYNRLIRGHLVCHLFDPLQGSDYQKHHQNYSAKENSSGQSGFYMKAKKNDNFQGAWGVFIDVDHTDYPSVESWLKRIPEQYLPTYFYTTYSHKPETPRFRLAYFFDTEISQGSVHRYRYVAWVIGKYIENWTGDGFEKNKIRINDEGKQIKDSALDQASLRAVQYMNGTNLNNPNFFGFCTGNIFSLRDFDIEENGYASFIQSGAYLSNVTKFKMWKDLGILKEKVNELKYDSGFLDSTQQKALDDTLSGQVPNIPEEIEDTEIIEVSSINKLTIERDGLEKWFNTQYAKGEYPLITRTVYRSDAWIDDNYIIIGPEYIKIEDNPNYRVRDGEKRRIKMWCRAVLRRLMFENITADILLYNYAADMYSGIFVDVEKELSPRNVINKIEHLMRKSVPELWITYKDLIENTQQHTNPKEGIIYKNNKVGQCNMDRHRAHMNIIDNYYDWTKKASENLVDLNNNPDIKFKVGKDMITSYRQEYRDTMLREVYDSIDPSMSFRWNKKNNQYPIRDEVLLKMYKLKTKEIPIDDDFLGLI